VSDTHLKLAEVDRLVEETALMNTRVAELLRECKEHAREGSRLLKLSHDEYETSATKRREAEAILAESTEKRRVADALLLDIAGRGGADA